MQRKTKFGPPGTRLKEVKENDTVDPYPVALSRFCAFSSGGLPQHLHFVITFTRKASAIEDGEWRCLFSLLMCRKREMRMYSSLLRDLRPDCQ